MRRLGTLPLMYQPGEQGLYDTGCDVLGVLIARATGQPLETRPTPWTGLTDLGPWSWR